jgi:hypothetical protein
VVDAAEDHNHSNSVGVEFNPNSGRERERAISRFWNA